MFRATPTKDTLEIGLLSPHNPFDKLAFSGTIFHAARALQSAPGLRTHILGPHRARRLSDKIMRKRPQSVEPDALDLSGLDWIVGFVATPLLDQVMMRSEIPCMHVTDATPAFLRDDYGWEVPAEADLLEARVVSRAALTVYSSPQMVERAAKDFGADTVSRATSVPFGINFENLPTTCPNKPPLNKLNLLFVGLDWKRKGGDIAVAALNRLREQGVDAHLTVVGRCPERHRTHPAITYAGYLNKTRTKDANQLSALYQNAHLLLLPSQADCTPMVIGEAIAHGTPVLASDTGGLASQVRVHGVGRLLPLSASIDTWAAAIQEITKDEATFRWMSDACFDRAETELSWSSWANSLAKLMSDRRILDAPVPLRTVV